jgi:hypothetical protein
MPKTKYTGVFKRTLKSGDTSFFIRYKLSGSTKDEAVGLASEGVTAKRASVIRSQRLDPSYTPNRQKQLKLLH